MRAHGTTHPPSLPVRWRRGLLSAVLLAITATLLGVAGPTTQGGVRSGWPASPPAAQGAVEAGTNTERRATRRKFPIPATTGVPTGWTPRRTIHHDRVVTRAGAHIHDIRIVEGDLIIDAPNVTVERVEIIGGRIVNLTDTCNNGLVVVRTTIRRGEVTTSEDEPAIGVGGYVARRVELLDVAEGFRVGGRSADCAGVRIINSWARASVPDKCGDWHGDTLQGYGGGRLKVRNSVLILRISDTCGATAPFFYPRGEHQGNTGPVDIDRLIVRGGGYPFRLGHRAVVRNLKIVRRSWVYGPIDVRCSVVSEWRAHIVRLVDKGARTVALRKKRCNTEGGY